MNDDDKDATSELEGRLLGLLETDPGTWRPSEQVDWIHDPILVIDPERLT